MTSFAVLVVMKETPEVMMRFAAYYHRIGAAQILLYHDGPLVSSLTDALDMEQMAAYGVEFVGCDEAFWAATPGGARPTDIEDRQCAIYMQGQTRCRTDWALICDADEFVIDRMPVPAFLDALPAEVDSVSIAPAEAVWGPGEDIDTAFGSTWFRRPDFGATRWERRLQLGSLKLYGPLGVLFRSGILSHAVGKQFIRVGAHFDVIDLHFSVRDNVRLTVPARQLDPDLGQVELAHFDAISFERWHEKFLRVVTDTQATLVRRSGRRRLQLRIFDVLRRFGKGGPRWFYRRLYTLTPRQAQKLEQRALAFQMDLFDASPSPGQQARSRA